MIDWLYHRNDEECAGEWYMDIVYWPPQYIECNVCGVRYSYSTMNHEKANAENYMGELLLALSR